MEITKLDCRNNFGNWLNAAGLTNFGVEIGVAYGENAEQILSQWNGRTLFLVDPWKKWDSKDYVDGSAGIDFDGAFFYCLNKLSIRYSGRFTLIRETSNDAIEKCFPVKEFFDFVYIDGNHHLPQIEDDIVKWWPLVKPGGVLCGHDYYDLDKSYYKCDVKKTVDAFAKRMNLNLHVTDQQPGDSSWWIVKP